MDILGPFVGAYGYPAVFGGMVIQQVAALIPCEPFLLGVGALAGTGRLSFCLAAASALAGSVAGDLIWYEIGRRNGQGVLEWSDRFLGRARQVPSAFGLRGASALLIGKIVPGLNGIGQPLAGALGMSRVRFLIFDLFGAILWAGLYLGLGYALHDQLAEAALLANRLGGWALVIVAGAIALYLTVAVTRRQYVFRNRRIAPNHDEALRASDAALIPDLPARVDVHADAMRMPCVEHLSPRTTTWVSAAYAGEVREKTAPGKLVMSVAHMA
jgi:membrane protein DedA with SNARE-associated domain